ncbi:MAG: helix-turn-helix transcriptional regulator [Fuerstiella sp.]|nr:helix-turn-helix transcriptional regulator [Fuerstiella sp.]MCP4858386.1 helix-turn-helix transcriptional regulator [Fuerstiella sp.]
MPKRKPTAAERKQWQEDIKAVDIEAELQDIAAQVASDSGISEAVDRLKAFRESEGISLRSLEESSGIPRGNLSRMESHQRTPTIQTLRQYAAALGKSVRVVVVDNV